MGPNGDSFLVDRKESAAAINDRAAPAKWITGFGLHSASPGLKASPFDQLQPRQPQAKTTQSQSQEHHHRDEAAGGNDVKLQHSLRTTCSTQGATSARGLDPRHA